jgi:carbamoyltransferase
MDMAASIQAVTEDIILAMCRHVHAQTKLDNLCLAGGVALNCVANGRIQREGPFERLWIQPAAGDAGGALGVAQLIWHQLLGHARVPGRPDGQHGSLLGPAYTSDDIAACLDAAGAVYTRYDDSAQTVAVTAELLAAEKVVGWMQGRMDFGPRALGSRSILGDPRSPRMQSIMNLKIKFRESFRPFAPCVLREFVDQVFEMRPGEDSPYMLQVAPVRAEWRVALTDEDRRRMQDPDLRIRVSVPRSRIPAVTHVDYSARIQTVDSERHGRLHRLMKRFHEITGCPVIVNTSFNIRGEPIVCNPEEAFHCFLGTEMDVLVLENCVLLKEQQHPASLQDADVYKAQYALD